MQSPSFFINVHEGKSSKVNKNSDVTEKPGQISMDMETSLDCDATEHEKSSSVDSSLFEEPSDYDLESWCDEARKLGERTATVNDGNEYLTGKVGPDNNAKKWFEGCEGLDDFDKSEIIIRLVYEVCMAENIENNLKDTSENEENKNICTRRIFKILKNINSFLLPQDRKKLVALVCQNGNVKALEMICKLESKDANYKIRLDNTDPWKGEFSGYDTLIELLRYVLKQQCSSEIVLCIAKKIYGREHILCNGEQYLDEIKVSHKKKNFGYQMKDCLKSAIELGYRNVVSVMLSGDIYHCIRLMKNERFQEEEIFCDALDMVEETVALVISSWVKGQPCKSEVLSLLKEGIELQPIKKRKKDIRDELKSQGIKLSKKEARSKNKLVQKFREVGRKVKLNRTVVGALISTLFFNHQNELMRKEKPFKLKISPPDKSLRKQEIKEFNKNIKSKKYISFVRQMVLKSIQSLNSSSHVSNNWFFREVLESVVNNNLNTLKAVCAAICKEKMEELIRDVEVHEDVVDVLEFFNIEPNKIKMSIPENIPSGTSINSHFTGAIKNLVKDIRELNNPYLMVLEVLNITEGLASGKLPAFTGSSRRKILKLISKINKTDVESKDLKENVSRILEEIKRGVNILGKGENAEYCIDIEGIFGHFKIINCELGKLDKREVVNLACQNGNVKLLEIICRQDEKGKAYRTRIDQQYPWKGKFTGYETVTDLLQYVLKQQCSPEVVLCIAKKVYGYHHNICNGKKYLEESQIQWMETMIDQPSSVMKECLKKAIGLNYMDTVLVMLTGDIYHCIRLMKDQRFHEEETFREALYLIEEVVADVICSWFRCNQFFKNEVKSLLKEGAEMDIERMGKKSLMKELKYRGIKVSGNEKINKLVKKLKEGDTKERLRGTVVGALISALFYNHQTELGKQPFKIEISQRDKCLRHQEIAEFNQNIHSKKYVQEKVLKLIKLLNSSSHVSSNWFFREVLEKVVNENIDNLKAVCAIICNESMQKLLNSE